MMIVIAFIGGWTSFKSSFHGAAAVCCVKITTFMFTCTAAFKMEMILNFIWHSFINL